MDKTEIIQAVERALDEASMFLHSMSDPTELQRAKQRWGSSVVRAVREVLSEFKQ